VSGSLLFKLGKEVGFDAVSVRDKQVVRFFDDFVRGFVDGDFSGVDVVGGEVLEEVECFPFMKPEALILALWLAVSMEKAFMKATGRVLAFKGVSSLLTKATQLLGLA